MIVTLGLCASACGGDPMAGAFDEEALLGEAASTGVVAQARSPPLLPNTRETHPACAEEEFVCGSHCADFNIDSDNCGGCGIVCAEGKHCQLAECVDECPP